MGKSAVILAGGEGKRMKSDKPKALSQVLDKPMLRWVIDSVTNSGIDNICILTGFGKEFIEEYISAYTNETGVKTETAYQAERRGTGHAVMMCRDFLCKNSGDVVVLNGDAPFMTAQTIKNSLEQHTSTGCAATVISARVDDPHGYGRIVRDTDGGLKAIVEHKDADEQTLKIDEVNSGGYWFDCQKLLSVLDRIRSDNAAGEYYLPDAIGLLLSDGQKVGAYTAECSDAVLGANDPAQLEEINQIALQKGYEC